MNVDMCLERLGLPANKHTYQEALKTVINAINDYRHQTRIFINSKLACHSDSNQFKEAL